jgi:hypothetical protein
VVVVLLLHSRKNIPDVPVWVNDLYNPLFTFWSILRDEPDALYEILKDAKEEHSTPDSARELFNQMKIELNHEESEDIYRAAAFTLLISVVSLVLLNLPHSHPKRVTITSQCEGLRTCQVFGTDSKLEDY